uniref:Uncharacterized protein n=1 Tax=Fagus sylvatica TaxID=28930 RepID=A0A2N9HU53_FAGSY
MNRSSDERVMAPGSRGIGAVFVHLSGEDSDQMGDAFGEPRVPRRSWSRYLSNAPGLVGSTCCEPERLCARRRLSGRKNAFSSQRVFLQILSQFAHIFDLAPDVRILTFLVPSESLRCLLFASFPIRIPARPDKILAIREFHVVHECVFFPTHPGLWINLLRVRKTLRASVATSVRKVPEFSAQPYFVRPVFTRMVDIAPDVGFRQSWYRRKAGATYFSKVLTITSSFLVRFGPVKYRIEALITFFRIGQGSGQFDSVFGLVNSQVKPWSNLVNLGRIWSKLSKLREMYPEPRFEGFWARWTPVGLGTARSNLGQTSVKPWSNLVNLGQTLGNVSWTFSLGVFDATRLRWIIRAGNVGQRINDSIFARSDFLGFRVLLRLSRSSSRFACQSLLGSKWIFQRLRMIERGVGRRLVARKGRLARDGPTLKDAARPFALISSLFLPFFALWTPLRLLCSFAHILLSGTPIDAPFSPTRSTRLRSTISFRLYVLQADSYPNHKFRFETWVGHPGRFVPDSSLFRDLGGHPGRFVPESQISFRDLGGHPGRFVPDSSPFRDLGGHPGRFVPESQISFRDLGGHPGRFVPDSSPFRDLGGHPGRFVPESQISFRDLGGHPGRFVPDSSPFRDLGGHPGRFVPESQISFRDLGGHPGRFVPDSSPFRDLGGHPGRFVPESQISFRDLGGHPGRFVPDSSPFRDLGGHPGRFVPEVTIFVSRTWVVTQAKSPATSYLGGNVCAKILSDPLQLGPRAKTLRQEVHFSYHTQLSDRQELLRSSRNLSQKMTPWHKEHSDGLCSQDHILRTQARLCARLVPLKSRRNKAVLKFPEFSHRRCRACAQSLPDSQQVDLRARAHWKEDTSMHDVELSDRQEFIGRKLSDGTKNVKIRHRELGQICARTGTRFEKKRAGSKTHFFSRTAAFARRVFPARNKLIREPGCVGKIMTPATSWNSRFAESIPRLIGIFAGRVHENSSDTPTSGSHNSLVRTPIRANFISLGKRTSRAFRRYAA